MKSLDCTILVVSCDQYADVLPPFVMLWRKFWPDCPFETVLLTETIDCEGFDRVVLAGKCNDWSPRVVKALEKISTPYVLMVLNDYFLNAPVDTAKMLERLEQAKKFDAANLRLNPNPPGRMPYQDSDLMEFPKNVAYSVTCQTGIWNREFLLGLAKRNKSAWQFERYGSFMLEGEKRPLLVTKQKEFPFVDSVHKGYWEKAGAELCERNNVPIDFAARSFPPLAVRIKEAFKKLIFAIFPWTLIVRIQNFLDATSRIGQESEEYDIIRKSCQSY